MSHQLCWYIHMYSDDLRDRVLSYLRSSARPQSTPRSSTSRSPRFDAGRPVKFLPEREDVKLTLHANMCGRSSRRTPLPRTNAFRPSSSSVPPSNFLLAQFLHLGENLASHGSESFRDKLSAVMNKLARSSPRSALRSVSASFVMPSRSTSVICQRPDHDGRHCRGAHFY